uniref:SJCHGC08492 protein n=1 Tax=Schistosoma japonicum TaxID=6182 RepID=Q5BRE6_SCHJA|nr:SJCHGC08492 protein [Schistosoma japonicum]
MGRFQKQSTQVKYIHILMTLMVLVRNFHNPVYYTIRRTQKLPIYQCLKCHLKRL